ncbi:unnamed protein product [Sphagnum tenellum]
MQRSDSKTDVRNDNGTLKRATGKLDVVDGSSSWYAHGTDADDYADWIQWAIDEEQRKQNLSEATNAAGEFVLLQIQQMEITDSGGNVKEQIIDNRREDTRWGDICQKL